MRSIFQFLVDRVRKFIPEKRFEKFVNHSGATRDMPEHSPSWIHRQVAKELIPRNAFDPTNSDQWRREGKEQLLSLLKIPTNPGNTIADQVWSASDSEGSYKKISLTGEYGSKVPLYVCVPCLSKEPLGTIICLQGHTSGMHNSLGVRFGRENEVVEPAVGRNLVKWCFENNFAAVCIEQRCMGERLERTQKKQSPHPCEDTAMHSLLLGRTLMGERLADIELCVRYIKESAELGGPIGIAGNSLGGTTSIYALSVLTGIDFAVAGSCASMLDDSIAQIYHCTDLYIPRLREFFEFSDIIGLASPKPLVLVQGVDDPIFPYHSLRKVEEEVRKIYEFDNASQNFFVKVGNGGHRFYTDLASEGIKEIFCNQRRAYGL